MTNSRKNQRLITSGLFLLFIAIYLFPLGNRPLAIPDETRYAEIPYEMLISGDWVTPRLNGLRYFEKPPLGYWVNALSLSAFGETNFAVRLSSALAAGLTTLLIYLFTVRITLNRRIAALAALIHLSFLEVYVIGTFSVLDNLLTTFLTAGVMAFYLAVTSGNTPAVAAPENTAVSPQTNLFFWLASGLSLGLAFLTKGFLALAIPVIVLVPWLVWHRHWKALLIKGWVVIGIAILVALPWGLLIHQREGDFWHYFFWVEHIKRFTADNAQHKAPFYYFLMYLPVLAFPWISLFPAAVKGLKFQSANNPQAITLPSHTRHFLWLWLLMPFLFFSASSGKLATYILPCFPPLAILTAVGLSNYLQQKNTRLFVGGLIFNILILSLVLIVIVISWFFDIGFSVYQQQESAKFILLVIALLTGIAGGVIAYRAQSLTIRLLCVTLFIVPAITVMHFAIPNSAILSKSPELFIQQSQALIKRKPDTLVISDSSLVRAVSWYLKRNDLYLTGTGEVGYGLSYPDAQQRLITPERFAALLSDTNSLPIMLFCRKKCPDAIGNQLPPSGREASKTTYGKFIRWYIQ